MILGTKDMRRFRLWETCSWKESLSWEPLIGEHPLGPIYWGVKINECKSQQICTAHLINETPHYLNQVLEIVSAEHNISVDKCAEYVPTLLQDISCYYQDQLILEPNSEEMVMSKEDKMVLNFYQENLKETFDDNGHRRLQLKLPWRPGCPHTVPESLHIAKRRLKGQQKKLANHPERAFKYKETFEKMKAEGHAEPVKETGWIPKVPITRDKTRLLLLKMAQQETCGKIIEKMETKLISFEQAVQTLPTQDRPHYWTQLYKYVPFLDDHGLLRIGGRLQNSNLGYHFKHPISSPSPALGD